MLLMLVKIINILLEKFTSKTKLGVLLKEKSKKKNIDRHAHFKKDEGKGGRLKQKKN